MADEVGDADIDICETQEESDEPEEEIAFGWNIETFKLIISLHFLSIRKKTYLCWIG